MGQKKRDFAEFKNQGKCRKKGTDMKHLENEVACFGATDEIRCQIGEELSKRYAFQPSNYIPEVFWCKILLLPSGPGSHYYDVNFTVDSIFLSLRPPGKMMLKDKWEELMNNSKETPPKDSPLVAGQQSNTGQFDHPVRNMTPCDYIDLPEKQCP
eukprot:Filipodium_phascolosomae@DN2426_c0_g1_i3.p1